MWRGGKARGSPARCSPPPPPPRSISCGSASPPRLAIRIEPRRVAILERVLREQLALARRRIEADLPAEVGGGAVVLEQALDELAAQAGPLAARRTDIHELVIVPQLVDARRVRSGSHQGGEHEPLRAADRHMQGACARRLTTTLRGYCSCNVSVSERRNVTRSLRSREVSCAPPCRRTTSSSVARLPSCI